jgi:2'-5' RNA ligase
MGARDGATEGSGEPPGERVKVGGGRTRKMRAFIAIEVPSTVREAVADAIGDVRESLPPARWVDPRKLHLTLRFLGDIEESAIERLVLALEPTFGRHQAFELQIGDAGTFPPGRPARVAWLGLVDAEPLAPLARDVRDLTSAFIQERRKDREAHFSPHLTVARCRRPWPESAVHRWREAVSGPVGEPFAVRRGSLVRSRLSSTGASYDRIRDFQLAGVI